MMMTVDAVRVQLKPLEGPMDSEAVTRFIDAVKACLGDILSSGKAVAGDRLSLDIRLLRDE